MTPNNRTDVMQEEYNNAVKKFELGLIQIRALAERLMQENRTLRISVLLETADQEELTLQEVKDKYFPNVGWDELRPPREDRDFTLEWLKEDAN